MTTLSDKLLARRDRAAQRHDRALDRFPDRAGSTFAAELDAVVEELQSICDEIDPSATGAEISRCFSWLADACFDRGLGREQAWLERGRENYLRAEAALGAGDVLQRAKLDYNFANTLRGLSGGYQVQLLAEAEARYRRALETFKKHAPNFVTAAETAVASIAQQRALAEKRALASAGLEQLKLIQAKLESGDRAGAAADYAEHQRTLPSTDGLAQGLLQQLEQMGAVLGFEPQHMQAVKEQTQKQMAGMGLGASPPMFAMLAQLEQQLDQEVAAGKVAPTRRPLLEATLGQLRHLLAEQPHDDLAAMVAWNARFREVMLAFHQSLHDPGSGMQTTAGARLTARSERLKALVAAESLKPQRRSRESDATAELFVELARLRPSLAGIGDDLPQAIVIEKERLRPLASKWRRYALRHHLILTWPDRFSRENVAIDSNLVAWFGSARRAPIIAELCEKRGLRTFSRGNLDAAQAAWLAVRSAAVVIAELERERGPHWAEVCYVLGLAACAGAPVVLFMAPNVAAPFDLDIPPVSTQDGADLLSEVSDRIDAALFGRPAADAAESTVPATLAIAEATFATGLASTLFSARRGSDSADPLHVRALLEQAIGVMGAGAPLLAFPSLPVPYPDPQRRSCFHVTPFGAPGDRRFERVQEVARAACEAANFEYLHGYEASDRRILRSIWNDIGRSTHALVDLSGQNPNVAYELGIAHALGRKVLCIGEHGTEKALFPTIAKERLTGYDPLAPEGTLPSALKRFLAS